MSLKAPPGFDSFTVLILLIDYYETAPDESVRMLISNFSSFSSFPHTNCLLAGQSFPLQCLRGIDFGLQFWLITVDWDLFLSSFLKKPGDQTVNWGPCTPW